MLLRHTSTGHELVVPDGADLAFFGGYEPVDGAAVVSDVPPRGGAGSGRDAWAGYAARHGVVVDDEDSREDIIAALDEAGVPTEVKE